MAMVNPGSTNLIAYYRLGEASGVTRVDSHNAYNLSDNNTVGQGTGKVGSGAEFDGAADYLDRAAQAWGFANAWTVMGWHEADTTNDDDTIFQFGDNLAVPENSAFKLVSQYIYVADSSGTIFKYYVGRPKTTSWLHYAVTWNGTNLLLYHNAVDITGDLTKTTDDAGTMANDSRKLYLGCASDAGAAAYFDGILDQTSIWKAALSSGNIEWDYNGGSGRDYSELFPSTKGNPIFW